MFYYMFINEYDHDISNIVLFEKNCSLLQTKNILIFLFNNFKFSNLRNLNKIIIVMSTQDLNKYHEKKKDDKYIIPFLKNENSILFTKESQFGNKVANKHFLKRYNILLDFIAYMKKNKYTDFIIVSGSVYLLYGLRLNSDIDIMARKRYKIHFKKQKVDLKYIDENSTYQRFFNRPIYTFYFKGIKILTLKSDLEILRSWRARDPNFTYPRAVADMLMAKEMIYPNLTLPINVSRLSENKKERLLKKIKRDYKRNYNLSLG